MHCARTVHVLCEKWALLDVFPPMAKVTAVTTVFPRRTAQILTQSKNSDNESTQTLFHTENAKSLSESAVFATWT